MENIQAQLSTCLFNLVPQLGLPADFEFNKMRQLVLDYYENDRVRYIEIYEKDQPQHWHLSGDGGVIGKTIPIAQSVETFSTFKRRRHLCVTNYSIIELLVADGKVKPVLCQYSIERNNIRQEIFSATYYVYYDLDNSELNKSFIILPPETIKPIASKMEKDIYLDLLHIYSKIGNYCNPYIVNHKAERASQALAYTRRTRIRIDNKYKYGKALELASFSGLFYDYHYDHSHGQGRDLLIFASNESYQFLYKTTHIYRYFKRVPIDEDCSSGYICEPLEEKQEHTYTTVGIADIENNDDNLIPGFY